MSKTHTMSVRIAEIAVQSEKTMLGPSPTKTYTVSIENAQFTFDQIQILREMAKNASPTLAAKINNAISETNWWSDYKKLQS